MTTIEMMEKNPELVPALTLAYIGDAVYELAVRKYLLHRGICKVDDLHKRAISLVRANTQAELVRLLAAELTEEETAVWRRGRNAKGQHSPKGATVVTYKTATGLEALIGYWHLTGNEQRLSWFFERLWQFDREREQALQMVADGSEGALAEQRDSL